MVTKSDTPSVVQVRLWFLFKTKPSCTCFTKWAWRNVSTIPKPSFAFFQYVYSISFTVHRERDKHGVWCYRRWSRDSRTRQMRYVYEVNRKLNRPVSVRRREHDQTTFTCRNTNVCIVKLDTHGVWCYRPWSRLSPTRRTRRARACRSRRTRCFRFVASWEGGGGRTP